MQLTFQTTIRHIYKEDLQLAEPFSDFAARFADEAGTVVLLSGGTNDSARYHILAADPWLTLSCRGKKAVLHEASASKAEFDADPFDILEHVHALFSKDLMPVLDMLPAPIAAGMFGYLSYDLKDSIEELAHTSVDDLCLPHLLFFAPKFIVVQDKIEQRTELFVPERYVAGKSCLETDLLSFSEKLRMKAPGNQTFSGNKNGWKSNFNRTEYLQTIRIIRAYISAGDVYQINMSQRFQTDFSGSAFALFKKLYDLNPAPFFAYIHGGDHQIVSTSPERFIKQSGNVLETRPIKGTCPRGGTPEADDVLRNELSNSKKDDAELSMIVDLLRNDLGKVCEGGSVKVSEHKRMEAYENVYHMVSIITGNLRPQLSAIDVIRATFPGGSITGCPKVRAMEIIDELEPNDRHVYTGSIGYISFHRTMDLSIAIRTATIHNDAILFSVGGGIVFDSDPQKEFEETLHKGHTLMRVLPEVSGLQRKGSWVWQNGKMLPAAEAVLPFTDLGVQYGFGCFETIRADNGNAMYLEDHLDRLNSSWKILFDQPVPDITWRTVIRHVLKKNDLEATVAAVKILATKGDRTVAPFTNTVVVSARPYTHRLTAINKRGVGLVTYPHPRETVLADHKSLNYLYYYLAGKWAAENGGDEALILNPDGSISETNTANIVLIKGTSFILPVSSHVLSGVMVKHVANQLLQWGYTFENKRLRPEDLVEADTVILTNSLMGAVPVVSLDGKSLNRHNGICSKLNEAVLRFSDLDKEIY